MTTAKRQIGDWGEREATTWLSAHGYTIIEHNYLVRRGELDIIAWHEKPRFGKTLCFIEVKTRARDDGSAERATDYKKLARIMTAAREYCVKKKILLDTTPIQFEQVSIYGSDQEGSRVRHFVIPVD